MPAHRPSPRILAPCILAIWLGCVAGNVSLAADWQPLAAPPTADDLPGQWDVLAQPDAMQALHAIRHLVAADARGVAFLAAQLRPAELPADRVRALIAQLDDDTFAVREAAMRELAGFGSAAIGVLRSALDHNAANHSSPEACRRLQQLARLAGSPRVHLSEELRSRRAICVLEKIGGDGARRVLSYLATGAPDAWQTRHAASAVERLARRPAAAANDPAAKPAAQTLLPAAEVCKAEPMRTFGTPGTAYQACFSPRGKLLATCSGDRERGQVVLWNLATGDQVRARLDLPSAATCLAFSPCGRLLAAGGGQVPGNTGGWINVWDVETGEPAFRSPLDVQPIYSVAISPDGAYLAAAGHDGILWVWELATGQIAQTPLLHPGNTGDATTNIFEVAFSPDGQRLASCGGASYGATTSGKVCVWDLLRGVKLRELTGHSKPVFSIAFSPCGRRLASGGGDQTVRLWDVETGAPLRTMQGEGLAGAGTTVVRSHAASVYGVVFSPDGRRLASADSAATWRVWDADSGRQLCSVDKQLSMYRLTFGADGQTIARTGKNVELWRLSGKE